MPRTAGILNMEKTKGGHMRCRATFSGLLAFSCASLFGDGAPSSDARPDSPAVQRSIVVTRPATDGMRYKLIPLETLQFQVVDSVCRPWLSTGGILTYEAPRNAILVYDREEVITKIIKFVKDVDAPPVNVLVEVEYSGSSAKASDALRVTGGRNSAIKLDAARRGGRGGSYNSMSVLAGNRLPATLWAGKTVVDPTWLQEQRLYPFNVVVVAGRQIFIGELGTDIRWADVGSKLMVQPSYDEFTGNVTVELFPVLSFLDGKGRERAVKVESLSTKVVVKEGQRVSIGGLVSAKAGDYSRILSGRQTFAVGSSSEVNALDMSVTCRAMRPDGSRR